MSEEAKNTVPETEQPETAPEEKTAAAAPEQAAARRRSGGNGRAGSSRTGARRRRSCRPEGRQEKGRRLVQQEGPRDGSRQG